MVLVVNCTKFLEELDILILLQFLFRDVITAQVEKDISQQLRIFLCERDGQIFIEQNLRCLQLRRVDRFIVIIVRLIPELVGGLRRPLVSRLAEDARPLAINIDAAVLVDGWPTFLTDIFFGDLWMRARLNCHVVGRFWISLRRRRSISLIPAQIVAFTGVSDVSVCVSLVRHLLFYGEFGRIHFPIGCMWLFFFLFELAGDKCDIFGKGSQCVRMLLQSCIHVLDVS